MAQEGNDLIPEPSSADHVRGSLDAPVVITEFGDYECPYCGDAFSALELLLKKYGERVALVFRHFPLSMHPHAQAAAEAAEAAAKAGKFWEMHDQLYTHQEALSERDLEAYGQTIGLDAGVVTKALKSHTYRPTIERDMRSGSESGVEGTPALYVNGFAYDGEVTLEELSDVVDRALGARSGAKV